VRKLCLSILLVWLSSQLFAQAADRSEVDCSSEAILKAGERTDYDSYRWLKRLSTNHSCVDSFNEIRMALAKRGDVKALRDVVCRLHSDDLSGVADDLSYIRGWFGIRSALLLAEQHDRYMARQRPSSDAITLGTPRSVGLRLLRSIVKNGPDDGIRDDVDLASEEELERAESKWRTWIKSHNRELKRRKPVGSSVSFASCGN